MTDFERMYTSLGREVDTVMLDTPDTLRHRADRRRRVRMAMAGVAVAALVGGIAIGGQWVLSARGPNVQPGPPNTSTPATTSATPTAGTSTPPPGAQVPSVIPTSAFLQAADTNGEEPPVEQASDTMLPDFCGARYASDSLVRARKTMYTPYWATRPEPGTVPDGTFAETITTYEQDGAVAFMQDLRDAVTACPSEQSDGTTYRHRILTGTARGDESVLVERRYPTRDINGDPTGGDDVRLISVVRTGAVVMVLYEQGWEDGWSAESSVVDAFTGKAFSRLRSWLG